MPTLLNEEQRARIAQIVWMNLASDKTAWRTNRCLLVCVNDVVGAVDMALIECFQEEQ